MDIMEEIKQELIKRGIRIENAYFIMGYLSDKPEHWKKVFLMKISGYTDTKISENINISIRRVGQIRESFEVISSKIKT